MRFLGKIVIVFLLLQFAIQAQADGIRWMTMNEALEAQKTKPKKIFIDIYTDWCSWCKRMDTTTFANTDVIRFMNQNYYCVKFNAEGYDTVVFNGRTYTNPGGGRRSTHPFAIILLNHQMTYPSFVVLDEQLRGVSLIKGYKNASDFYPMMRYFALEAYRNETLEEFKARIEEEE